MLAFCDANGRPDPYGDYQLINGKVCLRPGGRIGFDLAFMDATPATGAVFLTDAEPVVDAAERTVAVARAKMIHNLSHAHLGDSAPKFTAEDEARAISDTARPTRVSDAAALVVAADAAGVVAAAARQRMISSLTSGRAR